MTFRTRFIERAARRAPRGPALGPERLEDRCVPAPLSTGPHILLDAATLTHLRTLAAENTPQWRAFQSRLDRNLDVVIADDTGAYEGSELTFVSDYALGYQVLKTSKPRTAADYADKALGLIGSALHDYQKGSWVARQYLASGDGHTRTFTLPNADVHPATLQVFLSDVTTQPVVHGARNGQDSVDFYRNFLAVSSAPTGPASFVQGVDWRYNPNFGNDQIDWSLPGKEPATGARYYVTSTSGLLASTVDPAGYTLHGTTLTLARAPRADQAVFVQYIYGHHSADGSTLNYQETSAGDGGFNSIFVDDTYSYRYLGKHLAIGLDWLAGYPGFSAALQQQTADMLVRWSRYIQAQGYYSDSPASNYGAADYASEALTALAIEPRDGVNGPRLMKAVLALRQQHLLPLLQDPTTSLKGGFWAEGWNYGWNAASTMLLGSLALEKAGKVSAAPERRWAGEVVENLVSEQSAIDQLYDGGDWYAYPSRLPDKSLLYVLGSLAQNPTDRAYANYILQHYPDRAYLTGGDTSDYVDLLFHDPSAPARFWSALPLQDFATGTGLLTARSDWGSHPTWVSLQMGNLLRADHQTYSPGQLQISRGDDQLLVNAYAVSISGDNGAPRSPYGNLVAVDDNGDGYLPSPFEMGIRYGPNAPEGSFPGITINAYEASTKYAYLYGDYHRAYSSESAPGAGGPTSELTRQMVYLRPGYVFVFDRVTTLKAAYPKELRWHFNNAPVVDGNRFTERVGGSKLFAQTFSTVPLTTTSARITVGDSQAQVYRVTTKNSAAAKRVRYLTVFQVADARTARMDATTQVASRDGRMQGAQIGNQLVLFGRDGDVNLTTPVTYALTGNAAVDNLLTNLKPGQTFQVRADGRLLATLRSSSQGTLHFTTPAGAHTVQVLQ